jgi:hypothetical protein
MRILVTCLLLLLLGTVFAQDAKKGIRYPGYFINAKHDTIRGYILYTNKMDVQKIGEYSNDSRGEKIKIHLLPNEVKGFFANNQVYTSLLYGEADPLPYHFVLTLDPGYLKLYQYFFLARNLYISEGNSSRAATGYDEQYLQSEYIVITKDYSMQEISTQASFMKKAKELFADNPELISKIANKEKGYHYADLVAVFREYNESKKLP